VKSAGAGRLIAIALDQASLASAPRAGQSPVDLEREAAINDLMALNSFLPASREGGDFRLALSVIDGKLVLDVSDADGIHVIRHILSMAPFRRVVRDYFIICEAYYEAVASAHGNIEAIDVGRRGLHNEGAEILQDRLAGKISVDFETARRLFTLLTALHWKG
jgi:uncharacterized protein (UPF0262 family)